MTTIVLAAGLSERMGKNKLLLPFRGEAIIAITVKNALSFSDRVIVVVGNEQERIRKALLGANVDFVFNKNYKEGQRTSALEGVKAVEDDDFSILPGDLPLLKKEDAINLFSKLNENSIVRCSFHNIPGHPVAYKKENRERLLAYPGSMKDYLKEMGVTVVYFPYGKGVSSSSLREKIYSNYEKLKHKADNHFPQDICIEE